MVNEAQVLGDVELQPVSESIKIKVRTLFMFQLRFDPELCLKCESYDCLTKCLYLNYDLKSAREERIKLAKGEYSKVLEECMTCYGCEEYCPYNNHPFYRIVELQEEYGVKLLDEKMKEVLINRYKAEGEFRPKKVGERIINICLFPEFKDAIKGKLYEGYDVVRGRFLFCNLLYLHYGLISVVKERAKQIIENMSKFGAKEIVLFHDECYGFYNSFANAYGIDVPFKTIHLFEHLYRRLREIGCEKLGIKVAYQRPCSNRLSPETDKMLDKLFDLIGVERVRREYDRERAICCGAAFEFAGRRDVAEELQEKNLKDMANTDAEYVVFNCPMCYLTLSGKVREIGMRPIMVSELCKMSIGEEPYEP
ncbi:(Fe-S)-binding protein [Nanoarchaeota archaeon]|nr:MAG: (Fe-S)-binding protein [Nanoarchaeota archaeon]